MRFLKFIHQTCASNSRKPFVVLLLLMISAPLLASFNFPAGNPVVVGALTVMGGAANGVATHTLPPITVNQPDGFNAILNFVFTPAGNPGTRNLSIELTRDFNFTGAEVDQTESGMSGFVTIIDEVGGAGPPPKVVFLAHSTSVLGVLGAGVDSVSAVGTGGLVGPGTFPIVTLPFGNNPSSPFAAPGPPFPNLDTLAGKISIEVTFDNVGDRFFFAFDEGQVESRIIPQNVDVPVLSRSGIIATVVLIFAAGTFLLVRRRDRLTAETAMKAQTRTNVPGAEY